MSLRENNISSLVTEFLDCTVTEVNASQTRLNRNDYTSLIPLEHLVLFGDKLEYTVHTGWTGGDMHTLIQEAIKKGNNVTDVLIEFMLLIQRNPELAIRYETTVELLRNEVGMVPEELSREIEYVFAILFYSGIVSINKMGEFLTLRGSIPKNAILRPKDFIGARGKNVYSKWMALRYALQEVGKTDSSVTKPYENLFGNATRNQDIDTMFTFNTGCSWKDFREVMGLVGRDSKEENGILYKAIERTHMNGDNPVTMMYITLTHKESGKAIMLDFAEEIHDPHDLRVGDKAPNYDQRLVIHVVHHDGKILIKIKKKLLRGLLEDNSFHHRTSNLTDEVSRVLRTLVDTSFYNPFTAIVGIPLESGETCAEAARNIDYFVKQGGKLEGRRVEKEIIKDMLRIVMVQGRNAYYTFQDLHLLPLFPFGLRDEEEVMEIFELIRSWDRLSAEMILNPTLVITILNLLDPRLV